MVAAFVLPTMAQNTQEFQSTSTMLGSGSSLSSQVTTPGATSVESTASTTSNNSPAKAPGGPRKIGPTHGGDNPNPIGDAVLPLLLIALMYIGVTYLRKRKSAHSDAHV